MFDLRPYFCPKCGSTFYHNECLRAEHKLFCRKCPSMKICLNGMVLIMVAATLGVAFTIPYIILKRFEYEVLNFAFAFLPAIFGIATVGILRIIQKRRIRHSFEPADDVDSEKPPSDEAAQEAESAEVSEESEKDSSPENPSE